MLSFRPLSLVKTLALNSVVVGGIFGTEAAESPAQPVRPFQVLWNTTFTGGGGEQLFGMISAPDGYYLAGTTSHPIFGSVWEEAWIARTTDSGQLLWRKPIDPPVDTTYSAIASASDGMILLSPGGRRIRKLNHQAETIWERDYGDGFQTQVLGDRHGGCVVAAVIDAPIGRRREIALVALDANGELRWESILGGDSDELAPILAPAPDDGIFVGISSYSSVSGEKTTSPNGGFDGWILRLDSQGTIVWQRGLGGDGDDFIYTIKASDSGQLWVGLGSMSGRSGDKQADNYGHEDWWIVRYDPSGTLAWEAAMGGQGQDRPYSIALAKEGAVVIAGFSASGPSGNKYPASRGGQDIWVAKVDRFGRMIWQQTYGDSGIESSNTILPTPEGGWVIAGTDSPGVWMFELAPEQIPSPIAGVWLWQIDEYAPERVLSIAGPQGSSFCLETVRKLVNIGRRIGYG